MRVQPRWFHSLVLIPCLSGAAWGCRYNVRDVGFVQLEAAPYRLVALVDVSVPPDWTRDWTRAAQTAFRDANVTFSAWNVPSADRRSLDTHGSHEPRTPNIQHPTPNAEVSGVFGVRRSIGFQSVEGRLAAEGAEFLEQHGITSLPALVLLAPDGRSLSLGAGVALEADRSRILESVVRSPQREAWLARITRQFAVVALVEGSDPAENKRARAAIDRATERLIRIMDRFPKQVPGTPLITVFDRETARQERILLWSLGFELDSPVEPQAAIIHGRLRRIGPVLRGLSVTEPDLFRIFSVVGLDCECGLDRSWFSGPSAPVRWDARVQADVVQQLGFDAENPLVRIEVGQILARGSARGREDLGGLALGEVPGLGYNEVPVDGAAPADPATGAGGDGAARLEAEGGLAAQPQAGLRKDGGGQPPVCWWRPLLGVSVGLGVLMLLGGLWLWRTRRIN